MAETLNYSLNISVQVGLPRSLMVASQSQSEI